MTGFPQFPLVVYLGFLQGVKFPIDNILGSFMIIFLVSFTSYVCFLFLYLNTIVTNVQIIQFFLGFHTMRHLITAQTSQFMRLCEDEHLN
jgi:hypothetical protein